MKKFIGLCSVSLVIFLVFFSFIENSKANESNYKIDFTSNPTSQLFNVDNMKPGDSARRTLEVVNLGNTDFSYVISSRHESGSKELFNEFLLIVEDEEGDNVYSGKLKDFKDLPSRFLDSSSEEKLIFTAELPSELGNEFQGLQTKFAFDFFAKGHSVPSSTLPKTASNTFNLFLVGISLIAAGIILYRIRRKFYIKG